MGHATDHVTARLCAIPTGLSARCEVFVRREFLTLGGALVAGLGTCITGEGAQRALARDQPGSRGAEIRTIDAEYHRLGVGFVARVDQLGAVLEARVAVDLAVSTGPGALVTLPMLRATFFSVRLDPGQDRDPGSHHPQQTERFSTIHRYLLENSYASCLLSV
jgi:hypothetical protein